MSHAGYSRRSFLQGSASGLGLTLGGLWQAQASRPVAGIAPSSIRACILVFYYGGPSHLDTFDLKAHAAPAEVRGRVQADHHVSSRSSNL